MSRAKFDTRDKLQVGKRSYTIHALNRLPYAAHIATLPYCLKILLENVLRNCDDKHVRQQDVDALCHWLPQAANGSQIAFTPSRVVLQDFTGVPALVDLAAMRSAVETLGADPQNINPIQPVDLVIDHSVMVDDFGSAESLQRNIAREFERNHERYQFLRWGQKAFANFRVVPPGTGIVHQVNLEYLATVIATHETASGCEAFPDTLVGTDSHTTMVNGLGVLGWGVGGIEAEAAMLGQPVSMLLPPVVGVRLEGRLREGATATDLVLTITQKLRKHGVVGKFVEFYGDGLSQLPLADRATIANMAPEYGATCGIFPIDTETLHYLRASGREETHIALVEAYAKAQGLWRENGSPAAHYSERVSLNLSEVEPSVAGPKRPQDRIALSGVKAATEDFLHGLDPTWDNPSLSRFADEGGHTAVGQPQDSGVAALDIGGDRRELRHGDVVIAAITSCTNTSNPSVMLAAGLLAQKAQALGLCAKPWVKTSLAPGSQVVPAYLERAGLLAPLQALGFDVVGFGCTTCIGNAGPLPDAVSTAIQRGRLTVCAVLSGNRNFEGRIHPEVRANFLASPPLVVAYAITGTMLIDLTREPLGYSSEGKAVYLRDLWPSQIELGEVMTRSVSASLYRARYADVFTGNDAWQNLPTPENTTYSWPHSTYIQHPPYFIDMKREPAALKPVENARCLVKLGDSVTTDHISPAGAIHADSPAGRYLASQGVAARDFNSLGSRRGNHEVMVRGTFANPRLHNQLLAGKEGGFTRHFPSGDITSIYHAAMRYREDNTPLVILAGQEYGSGSSRDWAAKGVNLLGVVAVIAESFERIHRANLVGFGVLPLEFNGGENADSLGLTGEEFFSFGTLSERPDTVQVQVRRPDGETQHFAARVRIDTPREWDYYEHGGILHYVLRQIAAA